MKWIDEELAKRGLPRRTLEGVVPGFTEQKLSLVMSGRRKLTAEEADAIRRFFGYRLPDDPPTSLAESIHDQLTQLGDAQLRAVVLYLEALTGTDAEHQRAS